MLRAGMYRIAESPHGSKIRPCWYASFSIASRRFGSGFFERLSVTNSVACISPSPRRSPMNSYRSVISSRRLARCSPTFALRATSPSSSITSNVARDAAHATGFPPHGLDEDARSVLRRRDRFHVDVLDDVRAVQVARRIGELVRAAVTVRIRHVDDARHRREESGTLLRLARRQRESALGAPVERSEEREEHLPLRVTLGDFDGSLVRLRPRITEEDLLAVLARGDLPQPLGERRLNLVVEVGAREMGKLRRLSGDRLDDLWVRVTDVEDRNSGCEVDQDVAVDVFDDGAGGPLDDDRGRLRRGCNVAVVPRDDLLRLRAGRSHFDVRDLHRSTAT